MEFLTVELLLSAFNPLHAFFLTLMVNARHLFYGISMLEKYKNIGLKKFYLIYGMCDESFLIGLCCSLICLLIFGSQNFILPAMALIILCFSVKKRSNEQVLTRFLPFIIFPEGKTPPRYITYLGTVLPYAVIGLLVVYCLKDAFSSGYFALPEFIAIASIVVLHKWKKNTLLSIGAGTFCI